MDLGPINAGGQDKNWNEPSYKDIELERLIPDPFLDTANRQKIELPVGLIHYLDYVDMPAETNSDWVAKFKLETKQKAFECGTHQINASLTAEQVDDLDKLYGVDIIQMVNHSLQEEVMTSMKNDLYTKYKELGEKSRRKYFGRTKLIVEDKLGVKLDVVLKNDDALSKRLGVRILGCANKIAVEGRRGPAHFAITNKKLGSILMDCPGFEYAIENTNPYKIAPIGQYAGMTIFVNPYETEDVVVVGANTREHDPGVFLGEYKALLRKFTMVDKEFTPKSRVSLVSRRGLVAVGSRPEDRYYTMRVKISSELDPVRKVLLSMLKNLL